MRISRLRVQGLRCLADEELVLAPGINVLVGANGAGKTSVLEACFLLSHARSFRTGAREALLQHGAAGMAIFAEVHHATAGAVRVGLGRSGSRWEARIDAERVPLGELLRGCAVVCFEPGTHALIAGGAEERRRFLDWGVFHVEQEFLSHWRRYQRALKHRNALLRSSSPAPAELLLPWEHEMTAAASVIDAQRIGYMDRLTPRVEQHAARLLPELGAVQLRYRRGWPDALPLDQALAQSRDRDRARGHTAFGPHRADWSVSFAATPLREHLSRGQEKLTALACVLAQAATFAAVAGEWPVICLDDLASELDQAHQQALVSELTAVEAQVLVTGTELPAAVAGTDHTLFHVEQGQVRRLL